jgi:serine-type D-Ala-D-Ala carboxypeptidase (penicillin-binding protein 5/6)
MRFFSTIGKTALIGTALVYSLTNPLIAQDMDSPAKQVILIEASTGDILFEKNADERMTPSSMSKLMTIYIAFQKLQEGSISLTDEYTVENTPTWQRWRRQGSTMWLNAGDVVTIHDLLRGIIVQSGNDACGQLAMAIAGEEDIFIEMMNEESVKLGLTNSHFTNTNGWPEPDHVMSARDIALISHALSVKFPEYYPMFAEREYEYANVNQPNRNRLLYRMDGADGLKTGHTEDGGYGLASSAVEGDRRLVLVVNGMESDNARINESQRLLNYGFRNFNVYEMLKSGQTVDNAAVWLGEQATVPLVVEKDVTISMKRQSRRNMTARVVYDGPISAPIQKGQPIATLEFVSRDMQTVTVPLVAGADVDTLGGFSRIKAALNYMVMGTSASE